MLNHINKLFKIDTLAMRCVYIVDFLISISYVYMVIHAPYSTMNAFFVAFYSFASGMTGGIDIVGLSVSKKWLNIVKRPANLLICHIAVRAAVVLANAVYGFFYVQFWQSEYLFLPYELFSIVVYLRRYIFLKRLTDLLTREA
jgi:hypothetical protein